jgi:Tfp pilus assembly protein PilO
MMINQHAVDTRSLKMIMMLVCVVIVAATALYMIKPVFVDYQQRRETYGMLQNQLQDQAQLQSSIDQARDQIGKLQLELHGEASNMPVNEMESYLVGRLQGLSWDAGIELVGVRPGAAKRIMEFEEISFEVDVSGEYANLYKWLDMIGNVLGFMLVTNYDISLSGRDSSKTALNMHVTIVFYRAADI